VQWVLETFDLLREMNILELTAIIWLAAVAAGLLDRSPDWARRGNCALADARFRR